MRQAGLAIEILLGLMVLLLLARFLLSPVPGSERTSAGSGILQVTNWAVAAFSWLPRLRGHELSSLAAALLLAAAMDVIVLSMLGFRLFLEPEIAAPAIAARAVVLVLLRLAQLYLLVIVIGTILSWMRVREPNLLTVRTLCDRFLHPYRRLIPAAGRIDLSPLIAAILAQFAVMGLHYAYSSASGALL